jgi:hypothetical protein
MEYLPALEFNVKRESDRFRSNNAQEYNTFLDRMTELLYGDCFAVTVNNSVVYNTNSVHDIRDSILDGLVRETIMNRPHLLFNAFFQKNLNGNVTMYFYAEAPWFVNIFYNGETEILDVRYYKSTEYINRYG